MPTNNSAIKIEYYTRAKFTALATKDDNTIYFVQNTDGTRELYLGNVLINEGVFGLGDNAIYYIEGNTTGTAGTWTGSHPRITTLYKGLTVAYKVGIAGVSGGTTLNINGLGAKNVRRNNSNVTTHYGVETVLLLTYDGSYWQLADYTASYSNMSAAELSTGTVTSGRVISAKTLNGWLNTKLGAVYKVKGSVASYSNLPTSKETGDVWNVIDTGMNYVWTGTAWDALGTIVDLSGYATDAYVDAAVDSLNAELNAKVPDTRTINGIKLLQDITLTANDIDPNILRHTYYAPAWNLQEGSRLRYSSSYGWLTQNGPFEGEWEKIRSRVASTNLTSVSSGDTVGSVTCNTPLAHGNTIMIEVNDYNGDAYTPRFVTVTLGPASTSPNTTNDNNIVSFTTWNGTNLVIYSFSVKHSGSTLYFGSKKKIQGEFSGTTITWTTNDYTLQVGKVFRVKE